MLLILNFEFCFKRFEKYPSKQCLQNEWHFCCPNVGPKQCALVMSYSPTSTSVHPAFRRTNMSSSNHFWLVSSSVSCSLEHLRNVRCLSADIKITCCVPVMVKTYAICTTIVCLMQMTRLLCVRGETVAKVDTSIKWNHMNRLTTLESK